MRLRGRRRGRLAGKASRWGHPLWAKQSAPEPPATAAPLADSVARHLLAKCTRALLSGQVTQLEPPEPLAVRPWWREETSFLERQAAASGTCRTLREHALACEVLSWAEASLILDLSTCFAEAVARFQWEQTVLADEACPLPWGMVSYQAAVAACNTLWLASNAARGYPQDPAPHREMLQRWMRYAGQHTRPSWGDMVLVHLLHSGLVRICKGWHETADHLPQIGFWEWWTNPRKRRQWADCQRARAASMELDLLLVAWRRCCPLAGLLTPGPASSSARPGEGTGQEQTGPEQPPLSLFWALASPSPEEVSAARAGGLLSGRDMWVRKDGIQDWLARAATNASLDLDGIGRYAEVLLPLLESAAAPPPGTELHPIWQWRVRVFLTKFYALWSSSCRLSEAGLRQAASEQRELVARFLAPWRDLYDRFRLPEGGGPQSGLASRFREEYERLRKPCRERGFGEPPPETYEERLQALWDASRNVVPLSVSVAQ